VNARVPTAPAGVPKRLGRFALKRVLGRGAQATVWLAHDERLDRDVALKLLGTDADTAAVTEWLHEARAVSRLTHPHIVPVFEADEHHGQPYLVFEFVNGPTLSALLRKRGALPAREAVALMMGVLDALRVAHGSGIVHRDLKPSNILVDAEGRGRVMDFGIAARLADAHDQRICGTPGYMSPEAARGDAPQPAMDVFAAGMLLGEMLCGQPLLRDSDPYVSIERVQTEDMAIPATGVAIDDALRAVVMRAIARDAGARPASAADFHAALARWLDPETLPVESPTASAGNSTLEFLLRRMKHKGDFPALSDSVTRIQRVANNAERENLSSLTNEILKDVALTNKLLRLVNSAHYNTGGGPVSTVSRAVALVGFAGIRNMALSLVLLEHMPDKSHAQQLKEEFLRSLMAGTLAGELAASSRDGEEAFLAAMFQNLGLLLTEFYFPEEAQQIRGLTRPLAKTSAVPPSADAASKRVLGISFEELGIGVAKTWGLPEGLQRAMRKPGTDTPGKAVERGERQRWLGQAANEVADALLNAEDAPARIAQIGTRYARVLGIEAKALQGAAEQSQQRLLQLARAMNLDVGLGAKARRLMAADEETTSHEDSLVPHQLHATLPALGEAHAAGASLLKLDLPTEGVAPPPISVAEVLAAGIQDITNHMVSDGFKLNEVLRMILETMYRALGFRRIVFCLRDAKTETLTGRFGLGEQVNPLAPHFKVALRIPPGAQADLFTAVCLKGADTLIADATVATIAARLPVWFRQHVNAPAFLLLPLVMKGAPLGLIYADKAQPGGIALDEKELSLLRTLRNQAVMAFRQAT
jgi:eukaryotic-like serine/threonine-protein kinase